MSKTTCISIVSVILVSLFVPPLAFGEPSDLRMSCKNGDGRACYKVAVNILNSSGNPDDETARRYFERACHRDYYSGCAEVAARLLRGSARDADLKRAKKLTREGCLNDNGPSCTINGIAHELEARNALKEARSKYSKGCDKDSKIGCYHLGLLKTYQVSNLKNESEAEQHFEKACKLGDQKSCSRIGKEPPTESKEPKIQTITPDKSAFKYIEDLDACSQGPRLSKPDSGDDSPRWPICNGCPEESEKADTGSLEVTGGRRADFDGDSRDEAILSTQGCDIGTYWANANLLVEETSDGRWIKGDLNNVFSLNNCKPIKGSPRPALLCEYSQMSKGVKDTLFRIVTIRSGQIQVDKLLDIDDRSPGCYYDYGEPYKTALVGKIVKDIDSDGHPEFVFATQTFHASAKKEFSSVDACCNLDNYNVSKDRPDLVVWELTERGASKDNRAARKVDIKEVIGKNVSKDEEKEQ